MGSIKQNIEKIDKKADKAILKVKEVLDLFDPVIVYPYRGYGSAKKAVVKGRVLEKESVVHDGGNETDTLWKNLYKVFKRYESDEIPGVGIRGTFQGTSCTTATDEDGYFELAFEYDGGNMLPNGWHKGNIEIIEMPFDLEYEKWVDFEVLICNEKIDLGIISDVDDTIIKSHATATIHKLSTLLTKDATSRTPFEGVKDLYDKLVGEKSRPLFFVSGSAYNLYDLLTRFCEHQKIIKAPFLLTDLGMTSEKWFKKDTLSYKLQHITALFEFYPNLNFILIGDSGQKDPEIYKTVADKFPDRVKAIYIRHVDGERRKKELEKLKDKVNVDFLVMEESREALHHAMAQGWVKR